MCTICVFYDATWFSATCYFVLGQLVFLRFAVRDLRSLTGASVTHRAAKRRPAERRNSRRCWLPLLVGRSEALRASSLTGRDLTRRTRGTATRGCLTGTTRGTGDTGDTLPRYSNNLRRRGDGWRVRSGCDGTFHSETSLIAAVNDHTC